MKDIFGKALYSYWKGDHKTPCVIRRDDDYADESSLKNYFAKQFYPTEKTIAHHVKEKILDVGCGAGRHILHYQNRGYDITGIDNSPSAIKVCEERGCKNAKLIDIFHPKFPLTHLILFYFSATILELEAHWQVLNGFFHLFGNSLNRMAFCY